MAKTKIEWSDATWSPVTGCSHSGMRGCDNCWARRMATRLKGRCGYPADDPFKVTLHPDRLSQPLKWRKPRHIFVCSMGDLFHEDVPVDVIDRVFGTMWACEYIGRGDDCWPGHVFQVLSKRPDRMRDYFATDRNRLWAYAACNVSDGGDRLFDQVVYSNGVHPRIWLGTSASTQDDLGRNWPHLRRTPAALRFISMEPLLGEIDIRRVYSGNMNESCHTEIDWVIVGAESGPKARPCDLEWIRSVVQQCRQAQVPVFVKQIHLGGNPRRLSKNMAEWPEDLRVREMPR